MPTLVRNRSQQPGSKEGFAHSIEVELLYREPPVADWSRISSDGTFAETDRGPVATFSAPELGTADSRWVVELPGSQLDDGHLRAAVRQSWSWPEARRVAGELRHRLTIRDLRATTLDFRLRVRLMNQFIVAATNLSRPAAIHWVTTEQLVEPEAFVGSFEHEGPESLYGAVNVRLFRIDRDENDRPLPTPEIIMDTLGLTAVGLDDFQIHTREYDPHDVGNYLFSVSQYAWKKGSVISPGDEILGIDGDKWRCEIEDALVEPERAVIDIDTGEPGLAGRKR